MVKNQISLRNLIVEHLKEELPSAKHKETEDLYQCTVLQKDRPILEICVHQTTIKIKPSFGLLEDEFVINDDNIVAGKLASNEKILAADPLMFAKFDYCLAVTGCLVTMGWLPHPASFNHK